jgi:hypothetical protein
VPKSSVPPAPAGAENTRLKVAQTVTSGCAVINRLWDSPTGRRTRKGRISARLDNNRQIEFNAAEHRHFDHGYAVTSHSSQGLTAERVLVHADTKVHPDLLNSRFAYVSVSRASDQATLFTDNIAKLGPQLGADISKTTALEVNQPSSIGLGIGVGL